jgi:hypothetical protein
MEANLAGQGVVQRPTPFPYSNWGPIAAVLGVILALGAGILMSIPGLLIWHKANGDPTTAGNVFVQFATALGFLLVPMAIASWRGASSLGEVLARLGARSGDSPARSY